MAVAAVLIALVSGSCSDEPAPSRLSVRIIEFETGHPVAEARLVVEGLEDEVGEVARGHTDDDGVWTVTLPGPGTYLVGNLHLVGDPPCWWDILCRCRRSRRPSATPTRWSTSATRPSR